MVKKISDYQVAEDVFDLRDLMVRTLAAVVTTYESKNVPLPLRQYWTLAAPAEDCEQVVVSFVQMYLGAPGVQANVPQNCNSAPRSAVLDITVTRNYPIGVNGKPVSTADLIAASEWGIVDAWILQNALSVFDQWSDGIPGLGVIATITANPPGGGLQTTVLNLTVAVP